MIVLIHFTRRNLVSSFSGFWILLYNLLSWRLARPDDNMRPQIVKTKPTIRIVPIIIIIFSFMISTPIMFCAGFSGAPPHNPGKIEYDSQQVY